MRITNLLLLPLLALLTACGVNRSNEQPWDELQSGDLLFTGDTTGMGQAVKASTGDYTHVALVEREGERLYVIDATRKLGVARRPIEEAYDGVMPQAYRLTVPFDTAAVIARARAMVGRPYDNAFAEGDSAFYCSELVQYAFTTDGDTLFPSRPMNWRDAEGRLPQYWVEHFAAQGIVVPEGAPGTNPTDMSRSPLLRKL